MMIKMRDIRTDKNGFGQLVRIHRRALSCRDSVLEIDMSSLTWLEGNMCAPLGAVLFPSKDKAKISGARRLVKSVLQKNGFLPNFESKAVKKPDTYGTIMEYREFGPGDTPAFKEYVAANFVGEKKGLPAMSPVLLGRFRESIAEVFDNAVEHSNTQYGIFACGQFFPNMTRLDFCIADRGEGMRKVIKDGIGLDLLPDKAIEWALQGQNTTRRRQDGKPGGLGLKLIREFINLNKGRIQIVSDAGYWSFREGDVEMGRLEAPFPGTVVNIEINTGDTQSYRLASEVPVDPHKIF